MAGIVAGGCYQELAQMSEQEYWARREEIMPRLRNNLLSSRRLRWDTSGAPPYAGDVFWEEPCEPGYLYPEDKRALALLHRHLTPEQWACLGAKGYFEVVGKQRRYGVQRSHLFRIHSTFGIYEHEKTGRRHYCVVALEPGLPVWDWMLMVKMLIESDLRKFFATAKRRAWQDLDRYDA